MHKLFFSFAASLFFSYTIAQTEKPRKQALFLGAGLGLDHGGIGFKAEYQPFKYLGIFTGIGYDLIGLSGNLGVIYNILPNNRFTPVVTVMAGINGFIITEYRYEDGNLMSKNYGQYGGITPGAGFDVKLGKAQNHKINFMVLVPIRDRTYHDARRNITQRGGNIEKDALPLAIAAGWNYNLLSLWKRK